MFLVASIRNGSLPARTCRRREFSGKESKNFTHYSLSLVCLEEELCMRGAIQDNQFFGFGSLLILCANSREPQPIRAGIIASHNEQ